MARKKLKKRPIKYVKVVDFSDIREKDKRTDKNISILMLIFIILTFIVMLIPTISKWIGSFRVPVYDIELVDDSYFKPINETIDKKNYYLIEQNFDYKIKGEKIIFDVQVINKGRNDLLTYNQNIFIVDANGKIRGHKNISFENVKKKNKFKIIFNQPPVNQKILGEWNVYSYVYGTGYVNLHSIIKAPFMIEKEKKLLNLIIKIIVIYLFLFFIFFGFPPARKLMRFIAFRRFY